MVEKHRPVYMFAPYVVVIVQGLVHAGRGFVGVESIAAFWHLWATILLATGYIIFADLNRVLRVMDAVLVFGVVFLRMQIVDPYSVVGWMLCAAQIAAKTLIDIHKPSAVAAACLFWACAFRMKEAWKPNMDLTLVIMLSVHDAVLYLLGGGIVVPVVRQTLMTNVMYALPLPH